MCKSKYNIGAQRFYRDLTFKITKKLNDQQEAAFHLYLFAQLFSDTSMVPFTLLLNQWNHFFHCFLIRAVQK